MSKPRKPLTEKFMTNRIYYTKKKDKPLIISYKRGHYLNKTLLRFRRLKIFPFQMFTYIIKILNYGQMLEQIFFLLKPLIIVHIAFFKPHLRKQHFFRNSTKGKLIKLSSCF